MNRVDDLESTRGRTTYPFIMLPQNLPDDIRVQRLERRGGLKLFGLYMKLCFKLYGYRTEGLEACMPFDLKDSDSVDDLVYSLHWDDSSIFSLDEAIKLIISTGLLEEITIDGIVYIMSPEVRVGVLKANDTSRRQSERRKGKTKGNESPTLDDLYEVAAEAGIDSPKTNKLVSDFLLSYQGLKRSTKDSLKDVFAEYLRNHGLTTD